MSHAEFEIIRRYFRDSGLNFNKPGIELGIGDDAALLNVPEDRLLCMSMDVLVAGVHFPYSADPAMIANRALAVNLSDLAAMGAEPFCFTLGLVIPENNSSWLDSFSGGLLHLAQHFSCPLVGGDITEGPLSIAIQVQGLSQIDATIRRTGASPGDGVYVTGCLGDGAIALASIGIRSHLGGLVELIDENLPDACKQYFAAAYYQPEPRIEFARQCASLVNAGIDISDGLFGDLGHIVESSDVGVNLQTHLFPYSDSAHCCTTAESRLKAALYGGDDYELCLTVSAEHSLEFESVAAESDIRITCIGEIVAEQGIHCFDGSGAAVQIDDHAYEHFL